MVVHINMMRVPECVMYNLKLTADIYLPFVCLFVYGFLCICVFALQVLYKLDFFINKYNAIY